MFCSIVFVKIICVWISGMLQLYKLFVPEMVMVIKTWFILKSGFMSCVVSEYN